MTPFGGWDMPLTYEHGQLAEHKIVRTAVGMFDVSHMGQVRFQGG
jgi:aminomethyltransferase